MSNLVINFESHPFHASLQELKQNSKKISLDEITDENQLRDIGRIHKAIDYLDNYIKLIDPDINISNLTNNMNNLDSYIKGVTSSLNNFISTNNTTYLDNANTNIDNCLTAIKQFHTVLPKVSGRSISTMLKQYHETLEEGLSKINLEEAIESSGLIRELKKELIDGNDSEESVEVKINNMLESSEEKYEKLVEYYNETLNDSEFEDTSKERILNAQKEIEKNKIKAKEDIEELTVKIENLNKFYIKIFGELNDEDERASGLKSELDTRIKILDDFEKEQQKIHKKTLEDKLKEITAYEKEQQLHNKNIFNHIESLLPSATSAGLAKAYHDEREKFDKPIFWWNILFILSLLTISMVSFVTLSDVKGIEDLGKSILHSLPISGPLIWLAIYSSRRRSENQRLEQEYAHKEALAKSYSSYKKQIEGLKEEDQELLIKLLDTAINTMSYNASETLDKKHGDGTPAQEVVKLFTDELKKVISKVKV